MVHAQDAEEQDGSVIEQILRTIRGDRKQMDAEIDKIGLLRFLCESVDMNTRFCMDLDLVDAGYPPALNYIGAMYMNGEYFDKDEEKGFGMISTAAEKGLPKSMFNLSRMYRDGIHVETDEAKADEYEERAIGMRYLPAIIKREMRAGEITRDSVRAPIGFAIDHGAMEM